ncbi:MAG: DUF861 domain-containing protein [Yoonia sp.]|nr:DUF861 domain-containing protein [Yoonia sp.]
MLGVLWVSYVKWEYCHILDGHSVIHGQDGSRLEVKAGDSFILRPGFVGEWEVIGTTVKEYVIRVCGWLASSTSILRLAEKLRYLNATLSHAI